MFLGLLTLQRLGNVSSIRITKVADTGCVVVTSLDVRVQIVIVVSDGAEH